MIAEAHLEGEQVVRDAAERRIQLINEIQDLKRQKISFECGLRAIIESHRKLLDMDLLKIEEETDRTQFLDQNDENDERLKLP